MKICQFTQKELDLLREECNFTEIESRCFESKAKDYSDVRIAMELNISESSVAVIMRKVRSKITAVLRHNVQKLDYSQATGCDRGCPNIVYHSMAEWARIPDFLSTKGTIYVYADYRTENNINVPRIKIGDGISSLSEIPFATMSITDADMEYWDNKPDTESNDFGKIVYLSDKYKGDTKFVFPTDGYLMLEFDDCLDFASVNIYGAKGEFYFIFEKRRQIDIHSKEVFVKKGMKCEYVNASEGAKIKYVPLI